METRELDYTLPPAQVATTPADPRDAAGLLVAERATGALHDHRVWDLPAVPGGPGTGDLLVFNRTKVLPARLEMTRARTGGRVEGLYLGAPAPDRWRLMLHARGRLALEEALELAPGARLLLEQSLGRGLWVARVESAEETLTLLHRAGRPPLPPYIRKQRRARGEPDERSEDAQRYDTVLAREPGSVAAPTAALHFTDRVLEALDAAGIARAELTLHVGPGTFQPVETEALEAHEMEAEQIHVPRETIDAVAATRRAGGRVIPIGTTCVRALESLPDPLPQAPDGYRAETQLFIRPGSRGEPAPLRFVDALLTNFHLPRSTLLALVAAVPGVGLPRLRGWYEAAVARGYRFYSYGDAMLIV